MFSLKKQIGAAWPYMLFESLIRFKNEALKKVLQTSESRQVTEFAILIPPPPP